MGILLVQVGCMGHILKKRCAMPEYKRKSFMSLTGFRTSTSENHA